MRMCLYLIRILRVRLIRLLCRINLWFRTVLLGIAFAYTNCYLGIWVDSDLEGYWIWVWINWVIQRQELKKKIGQVGSYSLGDFR